MLTQEDDIDIHALRRRGWSISAIARHVGRDRKTIRAYLDGKRQAGVRAPAGEDSFAEYVTYCTARLVEDPHLWATALFDEVSALGYDRSYPSFTRALRLRGVRPPCEPCHPGKGRAARSLTTRPGRKPSGGSTGCPAWCTRPSNHPTATVLDKGHRGHSPR